jgi:hypothetical protein
MGILRSAYLKITFQSWRLLRDIRPITISARLRIVACLRCIRTFPFGKGYHMIRQKMVGKLRRVRPVSDEDTRADMNGSKEDWRHRLAKASAALASCGCGLNRHTAVPQFLLERRLA